MVVSDEQLYGLLADLKLLSAEDLKKVQDTAQTEHLSLYESLLKHDVLPDENIGHLVADSLQLPFVSLAKEQIEDKALKLLPEETAEKWQTIVFAIDEKGLQIASANPSQTDLFDMLVKKTAASGYRLFYATDRDIEQSSQLYKKQLGIAFKELLGGDAGQVKDLPVAKIVSTVIEYAYSSQASDIHIEPNRKDTVVRFRIDGVLHDVINLPATIHTQLVARVKVLARLRTDEHFAAQDGRMRVNLEEEVIDIRLSTVPTVTGEKIVMRLLASHFKQFGLTDLGVGEADLAKIRAGFGRPYGMVLSTGPTGSGKTTSMYAIVKILNVREKNIATIEDPVEYELEGINQIQVNPKTKLTFANGLRSILRQDPDIMYVGEIRDEETADIAINSAMTGHLVLSTLHTNDAVTTLPRLIDMGVEPFLVASTVNTIIGQRLVRKICSSCKASIELKKTEGGWSGEPKLAAQLANLDEELIAKFFGSKTDVRIYHGKGCEVCHNSGFSGRVGIFEVLEISTIIQELITKKANTEEITKQATKEGMTTMLEDGLSKVAVGVTALSEVLRATRE